VQSGKGVGVEKPEGFGTFCRGCGEDGDKCRCTEESRHFDIMAVIFAGVFAVGVASCFFCAATRG